MSRVEVLHLFNRCFVLSCPIDYLSHKLTRIFSGGSYKMCMMITIDNFSIVHKRYTRHSREIPGTFAFYIAIHLIKKKKENINT